MKFISHRGNLSGRDEGLENSAWYIEKAISLGYDVEVDVWKLGNKWMLGHDEPQYTINEAFLRNENIWCHAKNIEALSAMVEDTKIHCFWHESDHFTLTSKNYIWVFPGNKINDSCVVVLPEMFMKPNNFKPWYEILKTRYYIRGVCSDYISEIKKDFNETT